MDIVEAVIGKLVSLLIGWLWQHHEQRMHDAATVRFNRAAQAATKESVDGDSKAAEAIAKGGAVAGAIGGAGSLRDGSDAINAEIDGN